MPIFGGIFIGRRHGAFDSTPSGGRVDDYVGPSNPPAGSYNSTLYGVTYPDDQGGATFYFSPNDTIIPSQTCDVDVLNDGNGGTYTDWNSVTNVNYLPQGTYFYTDTAVQNPAGVNSVEVPSGSFNYYDPQYVHPTYEHDGNGGYQSGADAGPYQYAFGTFISTESNNQTEVPIGSGNYYENGTTNDYVWDGTGQYTTATGGSYYTSGTIWEDYGNNVEVPSGSGIYYNDGLGTRYVWTGGGNYGVQSVGQLFPNGTLIYQNIGNTTTGVEVPYGSSNYFDSELVGDRFTWDGAGGYNQYASWYYDSGTYITNDGTYDYYWDGSGGYYT